LFFRYSEIFLGLFHSSLWFTVGFFCVSGLLVQKGYSAIDIVQTMFRVCKNMEMPERLKLEYIREIGMTHMRVAEGVDSLLQMNGLVARLCRLKA
jgi:replication factor C subunit 2/4